MDTKTGIERIAAERQRQINHEGWSEAHDDQHVNHELPSAALCYVKQAMLEGLCVWQTNHVGGVPVPILPGCWPMTWSPKWWKPDPRVPGDGSPMIRRNDAIRMLEKAGALIAAEIDRLLRGADLKDEAEQC